MPLDEEIEICRVCRCPSTPEQPLHYPCKCSGSMKYVHQDCLEEWLQHSKKRQCEICNYPFSFTPIYSDQAPERISVLFFISVLGRRLLSMSRFYTRVVVAALVWLIWVPYLTVWIWRMHFQPSLLLSAFVDGQATLWKAVKIEIPFGRLAVFATTMPLIPFRSSPPTEGRAEPWAFAVGGPDYGRLLSTFFADVFEGQIIASIAVIICLAFLCLREYVVMNTPVDGQGRPINLPAPPAELDELPPVEAAVEEAVRMHMAEQERENGGVVGLPAAEQPVPHVHGDFIAHRTDGGDAAEDKLDVQQSGNRQPFAYVGMYDPANIGKDAVEVNASSSGLRRRRSTGHTTEEEEHSRHASEDHASSSGVHRPPQPENPGSLHSVDSKDHPPPRFGSTIPGLGFDHEISQFGARITAFPTLASETEAHEVPPNALQPMSLGLGDTSFDEDEDDDDEQEEAEQESVVVDKGKKSVMLEALEADAEETAKRLRSAATDYDLMKLKRSGSQQDASEDHGGASLVVESADEANSEDAAAIPEDDNDQMWEDIDDVFNEPVAPNNARGVLLGYFGGNREDGEREHDNIAQQQQPPPPPPPRPAPVHPLVRHIADAAAANPNPDVIRQLEAAAPNAPPADNNNIDLNVNNEMNAFLELVGVYGPLEHLLQSVIMVVLVIIVALLLGVWIPYWIGRAMMYMVKDVYAPGVGWAVEKLQVVTDPLLDPVVDLVLGGVKVAGVGGVGAGAVRKFVGKGASESVGGRVKGNLTEEGNRDIPRAVDVEKANETVTPVMVQVFEAQIASSVNYTDTLTSKANLTVVGNTTLPSVGSKNAAADAEEPEKFLGIPEKILFTIIGYFTQIFFIFDYARRTGLLQHPYAQTLKRISLKWFSYLGMGIKFSFFLTIELGAFPLFCGILIDICTLPLFGAHVNLASRWAFYKAHPWTSEFLHWLAGTTFMFQFALYISTIRRVVRPGVMWFIRDPNDPQFHPMNDILERPVLTQIRKLAFGTMMYALMVVGGVGGVVGCVWVYDHLTGQTEGPGKMWPLKWDLSEPMSEFPIDLLIFHFVVPWTVAWIQPKELLERLVQAWFRVMARHLRLTSFLIGGVGVEVERIGGGEGGNERVDHGQGNGAGIVAVENAVETEGDAGADVQPANAPVTGGNVAETETGSGLTEAKEGEPSSAPHRSDTEGEPAASSSSPTKPTTSSTKPRTKHGLDREFPYMRVPNHDHVELIPGERMLTPMRRDEPLRGREGETEEEVRLNWTKVYVPEDFKIRVGLLLFFQWVCGTLLIAAIIIVPLFLGRTFFIQASTLIPNVEAFTTPSYNPLRNATLLAETANNTTTTISHPKRIMRPDLPVHDMYSYAVGIFLLFLTLHPVIRLNDLIRSWQRRTHTQRTTIAQRASPAANTGGVGHSIGGETPARIVRRHPWRRVVRRWVHRGMRSSVLVAKLAFLGFMFGILLPLLEGLLFDMYLIQPFRPLVVPRFASTGGLPTPVQPTSGGGGGSRYVGVNLAAPPTHAQATRMLIQALLQDWALGAVYMKIGWALVMVGPENDVQRVLREMVTGGVRRVRVRPVWNVVIRPLLLICLALTIVPISAAAGIRYVWKPALMQAGGGGDSESTVSLALSLRWAFPGTLVCGLVVGALWAGVKALLAWMEQIREEQFLVGRRLHNLDDGGAVAGRAPQTTAPQVPAPVVDAPVRDGHPTAAPLPEEGSIAAGPSDIHQQQSLATTNTTEPLPSSSISTAVGAVEALTDPLHTAEGIL
ncbi:uncharacterized protein EV422DRAFT_566636 [Fimicolochytrium jonesii]|uniref:uncharacterized protein n=1 Tax=Fimicolochytrium jonesii TaxID=1396493 RepID=UPI0022FE983A|nr:uncharacterized protein EV422DRAFT_566636 [Fimicolochytrium jonesii]KAI8822200.1 hypothetical protein EV422DRAFT_566636 [Fimicolochytrium jonesii]